MFIYLIAVVRQDRIDTNVNVPSSKPLSLQELLTGYTFGSFFHLFFQKLFKHSLTPVRIYLGIYASLFGSGLGYGN